MLSYDRETHGSPVLRWRSCFIAGEYLLESEMRTGGRTWQNTVMYTVLFCAVSWLPVIGDVTQDAVAEREQTAPTKDDRDETSDELEELGTTLKAAVMSGAMSEEEAKQVYLAAEATLLEGDTDWRNKVEAWMNSAEGRASPKARIMRLSVPEAGRITALWQPDFSSLQLSVLRDELRLDRDQMEILRATLGGYQEAIELASAPLRDALQRYQRARIQERVASSLERVRPIRTREAVALSERAFKENLKQSEEKLEEIDEESRAKWQESLQQIADAAASLDERLAILRERAEARLADAKRERSQVTANDLVSLAVELRDERVRLSSTFTDMVELVVARDESEAELERVQRALALMRINQELQHGRLSGETMNLWVALSDADLPPEVQITANETLNRQITTIAALVDQRRDAALDREIRGLEYLRMRDRSDADAESRLAAAAPFATACWNELTSSIALRDALYALLKPCVQHLEESHPETNWPSALRDAALRRGFPAETRTRWSERAIVAALQLESLDENTRDVLLAIQTQIRSELAALRTDAVARSMARDPKLARDAIDRAFGGNDEPLDWEPEMWLGHHHEGYESIDERVEGQLRALLSPEQLDALPARMSAAGKRE